MKHALFASAPFIETVSRVYRLREVPVLDADGPSHVPFFASTLPFKKAVFNLPLNFYQTADFFRERWQGGQWQRVIEWSARNKADVTLTTLGSLGIEPGIQTAHNPVLRLAGVEQPGQCYSANLRSNLRKEWNKARRHGIEVVVSTSVDDARAFYRVLARQYVTEHRMVFQPFALYEAFLRQGAGLMVLAKRGGEVLGGLFLLADGEVLHYNWGARTAFENVSIGTLLIDHAIHHAVARGCLAFDFGSTPLSDRALLDFKLRWGADNLPVFKYYTRRAPSTVDLNTSFAAARRLFSAVPVGVAAAMMPTVVPWLVS